MYIVVLYQRDYNREILTFKIAILPIYNNIVEFPDEFEMIM